jgi:SseB protein N-terminal domain
MTDLPDLGDARLLVPIRGADPDRRPPEGLDVADLAGRQDDPVRPVVVDLDGGPTMLLFTSADAARRWRPSISALAARGDRLLALAERMRVAQVVIDVADPPARRITVIENGPQVPPGSGGWRIRGLAGPLLPGDLHRLRRRLGASPAVASAHVVEVTDPRTRTDHVVLALDVPEVTTEAAERVARELLPDVLPLLPGRLYHGVQVTVMTDPGFRENVRGADAPVYERG